jgi:hypothetical protein
MGSSHIAKTAKIAKIAKIKGSYLDSTAGCSVAARDYPVANSSANFGNLGNLGNFGNVTIQPRVF